MTMISSPSTSTRSPLEVDIVGGVSKKARRLTSERVDLITRPRPFFLVDLRRIKLKRAVSMSAAASTDGFRSVVFGTAFPSCFDSSCNLS